MADIRTTPQIDAFNRADENPLSAGGLYGPLFGSTTAQQMQNASNQAKGTVTSGTRFCYSCYLPATIDGDFELWGDVAGFADNINAWTLSVFNTIDGAADHFNGYVAAWYKNIPDEWFIDRYDDAVATRIATWAGDTVVAQTQFLFRSDGNELHMYRSADGGATWPQHETVTDGTYRTGLHLTIGMRGQSNNAPKWDGWGGGVANQRRSRLPYLGVGP